MILILLIYPGCDNDSPTEQKEKTKLKSEALEFSLKVIKAYIESDTTAFKTFLLDTIYLIEPWEEPIPTSSVSITNIFSKFDYTDYTMEDFNNNYSSKIYSFSEYKDHDWVSELVFWHPDSNDYLFMAHFIEGGDNFFWEDLRAYVVTKINGNWKLKAFSG